MLTGALMVDGVPHLGIEPEIARSIADLTIGLSCFSLAVTVAMLTRRLVVKRSPYAPACAAAFFALAGASYLAEACSPWVALPFVVEGLRASAAAAAVTAALVLPMLLPRAAALARGADLLRARSAELTEAHRELDAALAKAKELEAQLFANVSHELRTPLALILGPTERLLSGPDLLPSQRTDLEVVARNARTLLRHVGDLLHVATRESGALTASYGAVDLAELLRATTAHFDGFAADRGITYVVDAPVPIAAEVDTGKLQRALLNLLSNAFKFTPPGGTVRCSAREIEGGRLRIEVADSGPGVPPPERRAVFERFHRIEGGSTKRFGGTGLGLAIVKDVAELMRGEVSIGDAPEGGALLAMELPLRAPVGAVVTSPDDSAVMTRAMVREALDGLRAEPGEDRASPPETDGANRPLVLVIEDNPDMNRFVAQTLASDLRVVSAYDGQSGLQKAIELRPDLVVSDVMMPGLSGDALVREMRARPELDNVPVVMLTAKTDDALRVRLLREGVQDFVGKPFFAEELRARVKNLVSMKRARDILQADLASRARDLESLAGEVAQRRRELSTALDSARVARDHADRASAMKTGFLRMVSHELRTPLTSLKLNLERLARSQDAALSARQEEMVRKITVSAGRLHELIESLLEYARIESGRLRVEIEDVDVRALCASVIEELAPQAEQKSLALRLAPAAEMPPLATDPRLLRLVIVNLVGNAVKFTPAGEVVVEMAHGAGAHEIRVRDTGPGIPAQDHPRIFEPFEQMEPLPHKHTRGLGLGLSIVKEIVEALAGRIELCSEVGAGSTFTVVLPPRR